MARQITGDALIPLAASRADRMLMAAAVAAALPASACAPGPPPTTLALTAPRQRSRAPAPVHGHLIVAPPSAIQVLSTDRIVVKDSAGTVSYLPNSQWVDQLPALVQARLIQTFENASRLGAVSRPGDRVDPDYQLNTELRAFQIEAATNEAFVEISAKAVDDQTGRIVAARIFNARVPVPTIDAANATQGLDAALSLVLLDIVRWAGTGSGAPPTVARAPQDTAGIEPQAPRRP